MTPENKIYNPASQPKDWLIEHFVVRTNVFEKLFKEIRNSKMKYPEQHYLIQGQRGMGKTTLLLRLKYEIENTPELNRWLVPVFFNEESYDLTSLSNLWEKLLNYLDDLWQTTYYMKTDEFLGKPDYEKKCFSLLIEALKTQKKKLIIFFDNFGQLFLDNLSGKEQHRFREILMNCAEIRIVGASPVVVEELYDYSKPFFDFFKIINLEGLNKDETVQLISKLQEKSEQKIDIEKSRAKIETLAILTSGVIRTIMLIYEVVLSDEDGSALRDLEIILDRITPLYKHRIEDLPVQQRKIVDVIAKKWDAISAKEIAAEMREDGKRIPTKRISAQLQQLEKNNVVEVKKTNTKNHLYQLKERFFNIWYLMRSGDRLSRSRVIWLTKFLEMWYEDENGFKTFLHRHIQNIQSGSYLPYSAVIVANALLDSEKLHIEDKKSILDETHKILSPELKNSLLTGEQLLESEERKGIHTGAKLYDKGFKEAALLVAIMYFKQRDYENSKKYVMIAIKDGTLLAQSYFLKGGINYQMNNARESEDDYRTFLEMTEDDSSKETKTARAMACISIASIYYYEKKERSLALEFINSASLENEELKSFKINVCLVQLWNDRYSQAFSAFMDYAEGRKGLNDDAATITLVTDVLLLFMAKKQYHTVLKIFQMENLKLKEKLKPVYYALSHFLKDEYPLEILKMGDELKQPVADILKRVEKMAIDYA